MDLKNNGERNVENFYDRLKELEAENKQLKSLCREYESLLENSYQRIWAWDIANDRYYINESPDNPDGYNLRGREFSIESWKEAIHPEDMDQALGQLQKALDENHEKYENIYRIQTKKGTYRWIHSKGKTVKDPRGNIVKITGSHMDITEKLNLEKKLFTIANYDALTQLPNKEKLSMDYAKLLEDPEVLSHGGLAFFFMDIDNFGYINSILGYDEGNTIIKEFSNFLRERYPHDLVSRISADEFVLIHRYKGDVNSVAKEGEALTQVVKNKKFIKKHDVKITISMGIALYQEHGEDFYDLLKNADIALYYAKRMGKDRFHLYHEKMELKVFNNVDLINRIRVGLSKEEFHIYYQPIVNTETEVLAGLEGLIRWKHREKGFISPMEFIPVAEETGTMKVLEKWIIDQVFKQVKIWVDKGEIPIFVSINLSSKGLIEDQLVEYLDDRLKKYKISPEKIKLEMTETAMLKDISRSVEVLKQLVEKGFTVALDDFGTGYSSLSYLKSLPIGKVKLDKSFIDSVIESRKDRFLLEAIISLSHRFNLKVIAEGVEREEQVTMLQSMDCDYIQGYYYGKPMNVEDTELWIRNNYMKPYFLKGED